MTASHITLSASHWNADLARERRHSTDESARAPEQDFRDAFQRHMKEHGEAPQRAKTGVESSAASVRQKEPPSGKPAGVTPTNLGQQAAPLKAAPEKSKQAPTGSPSLHSIANGTKQQKPAGAGQQRKLKDEPETESDDEQPASISLSAGEQQPLLAATREADDQVPAADEYVGRRGSDDDVQAATPAVSATGVITGGLAMALRIDSPRRATDEESAAKTMAAPGVLNGSASMVRAAAAGAPSATEQKHDGSISAITGTAATIEGSTPGQAEKSERAALNDGTNPADFEAEFAKFRTEPVRGAHVQIDGSNNERVDIRLLERGGALSVSVRSGDTALTRALQDHATELNARLTTEHFRTELWTPGSGKQASGRTFEDGRGQSQGGSSNESAPDKRQHGKQQNEPAWIEDFENQTTAFQKRIEYTWHQ